jgi:hypothetical protein
MCKVDWFTFRSEWQELTYLDLLQQIEARMEQESAAL